MSVDFLRGEDDAFFVNNRSWRAICEFAIANGWNDTTHEDRLTDEEAVAFANTVEGGLTGQSNLQITETMTKLLGVDVEFTDAIRMEWLELAAYFRRGECQLWY